MEAGAAEVQVLGSTAQADGSSALQTRVVLPPATAGSAGAASALVRAVSQDAGSIWTAGAVPTVAAGAISQVIMASGEVPSVASVRLTLPASMELSSAAAAQLSGTMQQGWSSHGGAGALVNAQVSAETCTDASGRAVRVVEVSALLPAVAAGQRSQQAGVLDSAARAALEAAIPGASFQLVAPTQASIDGSEESFGTAAAVAMEGEVQVISFSATLPAAADGAARQAYCESVRSFLVAQGELFAGRGLRHSPGGCFL